MRQSAPGRWLRTRLGTAGQALPAFLVSWTSFRRGICVPLRSAEHWQA